MEESRALDSINPALIDQLCEAVMAKLAEGRRCPEDFIVRWSDRIDSSSVADIIIDFMTIDKAYCTR